MVTKIKLPPRWKKGDPRNSFTTALRHRERIKHPSRLHKLTMYKALPSKRQKSALQKAEKGKIDGKNARQMGHLNGIEGLPDGRI